MPRRFSEEEAERVFARAAERQHAHAAPPDGLTLAELQQIGREAGLDPAHVSAAVAETDALGAVAPSATYLGVPLEPRASRLLVGEVYDETWEQMVNRLRRTFRSKGAPVELGRVREWSSGLQSNLHVSLEPAEGGTLLTLETSKAETARGLASLPASAGVFVVLLSLLFGFGDFDLTVWIVPLLLVLGTAVAVVAGRQSLAAWSEKRQAQFDALLDQFELVHRKASVPQTASEAAPPEDLGGAGRLDLDDLPEPDADRTARRRTRAGR